jgi:hypothetical protein
MVQSLTNKLIANIKKSSFDTNNFINSENVVTIDSSNIRIGVNTKNPRYAIDVSGSNNDSFINSKNIIISNLANIKDISCINISDCSFANIKTISSESVDVSFLKVNDICINLFKPITIDASLIKANEIRTPLLDVSTIFANDICVNILTQANVKANSGTIDIIDGINLTYTTIDCSYLTVDNSLTTKELNAENGNFSNSLDTSGLRVRNDALFDKNVTIEGTSTLGNTNIDGSLNLGASTINGGIFTGANIIGPEIDINGSDITFNNDEVTIPNLKITQKIKLESDNTIADFRKGIFALPLFTQYSSDYINSIKEINSDFKKNYYNDHAIMYYDENNKSLTVVILDGTSSNRNTYNILLEQKYINLKLNTIPGNNRSFSDTTQSYYIENSNNLILTNTTNNQKFKYIPLASDTSNNIQISNNKYIIFNDTTNNSSIYEINTNISVQYLNKEPGDVEANNYTFGIYRYNITGSNEFGEDKYPKITNSIITLDNSYNYSNSSLSYIGPIDTPESTSIIFLLSSTKELDYLRIESFNATIKRL